MTATLRGLAILVGIALALTVALLVLPSARTARPAGGRIAASFTGDVTQLTITRGADTIVLHKEPRGWVSSQPRFVADDAVISALLAAVRDAKWHREARPAAAGALRGNTTVQTTTGTLTFAIGQELAGAAQTWIVRDRRALLVDSWVVNALWPDALHVRVRFPFAEAPVGQTIDAGDLHLRGMRRVLDGGRAVWLDPARVRELVEAMVALELVSLDGMTPGARGPSVTLASKTESTTATAAGTCAGGRVLLEVTTGDGCVEAATWQRVLDAAATLLGAFNEVADLRPLPITPVKLTFANGTILDLQGRPRIGAEDADPARVDELLAALAAPATFVVAPSATPGSSIVATAADGTAVKLTLSGATLSRESEPFALHPDPAAYSIITRPASSLRDPVLWREDVTTLTSLTIDGISYRRGAVLGEWTRSPAGPADTALVEALASTLASVRAPAGPAPAPITHHLSVTFTPPAGAPSTHTLELGAPAADGCAARVDRAPVRLDLPLCMAAIALASAH